MAKGGQWTYKIQFYPDEDTKIQPICTSISTFLSNIGEFLNPNEKICDVYAYKTPLSDWQTTSFIIYHLYIVFKTEHWWWSIEKDGKGIVIRRSKVKSTVRNKNKKEIRGSRVYFVKQAMGKGNIGNLVYWLRHECELFDSYHFLFSNCKSFAKRVFDYIAYNEQLCWYHGAFSI